ncbi:hypothetical protein [Escherichia coli]|uniref:hypothetical protein n=1 Tax=Escherichia coli TaxID=562 RepID=UPI000F5E04CE|nr:hypothetical protein [Escherichia coli]RRB59991.1 hypothetical protein EIA28_24590 [Escherichia coli]
MSQYSIQQSLGNASGVAVSPINADATLSTGVALNSSLWAGIGVFARGKPFTVLAVTESNYEDVLGEPLKPSSGSQFEPIRHVYEAIQQTSGYVVRAVPDDAKFPIIMFDESGEPAYTALPYGSEIELDSGEAFAIYVDDGDPCISPTHELTIETATADSAGNEHFLLKLTQTTSLGVVTTLETHTVSLVEEAKDDMGRLCYLPTALEARSKYLRAVVNEDLISTAKVTNKKSLAFTGGTNGDQSKISTAAYLRAVKVLNNAPYMYTAVLGLGCYDNAAITALGKICADRLIDGFFDVKPTLTYTEAISAVEDTGLLGTDYVSCAVYHFPFSCKDKWTQSRVVFGLSGAAYAAKARGVKKNSDVGGWHYSPAGEERAVIARASIQPLYPEDTPDEEAMVKGRLNKVSVGTSGQMIIDDALTCCTQDNYLHFQHVPSLMNAISRFFVQLARQMKHSPDGITAAGLTKGMTKLLDRFVASGALVAPRDPDADGTEPYVLKVTQAEFDKWEVVWACCPTGVARRIHGVPLLIK